MSRDNAALLDVVRAGQLVLQFAQGISQAELASDLRTQSAILYQVSIMGEAQSAYHANSERNIWSALGRYCRYARHHCLSV